jgi:hypothetical protein
MKPEGRVITRWDDKEFTKALLHYCNYYPKEGYHARVKM